MTLEMSVFSAGTVVKSIVHVLKKGYRKAYALDKIRPIVETTMYVAEEPSTSFSSVLFS